MKDCIRCGNGPIWTPSDDQDWDNIPENFEVGDVEYPDLCEYCGKQASQSISEGVFQNIFLV